MPSDAIRRRIEELLGSADVRVGRDRPWDIRAYDQRLWSRVLAEGSLGLGESYMDGWWDCDRLDEFFDRVLAAELETRIEPWKDGLRLVRARLFNLQKPSRAFHIGRHHYDIGTDLFSAMLDQRLIYSCG